MSDQEALDKLLAVFEAYGGLYGQLSEGRADDIRTYLALADVPKEDEETLTEPILGDLLERLLGFPRGGYVAQLSRSGLKPDFTPTDLVAHRFVFDAKSSRQRDLGRHEDQIRTYMEQRRLDHGVLFNLREFRVYRLGERGHDPSLSFSVVALLEHAAGRTLSAPEVDHLAEFARLFGFRQVDLSAKVRRIRNAPSWRQVQDADSLRVDVDYLVVRLRELSRALAEDAAVQAAELPGRLAYSPARSAALVGELRLIALEIQPGADPNTLPGDVAGFQGAAGLAGRAFRQYLQRVAQLALVRVLLYRAWEDAGFVAEHLYDGGFGATYERVGHEVTRVLEAAFTSGRQRYRWLYGEENNYDWYRPREDVLVDLLYALLPVPLGRLDADVLGGLYESYVDDLDRDRLGQFYTPRSVVRFMLDRAGFVGREGLFRLEADRRVPRRVLDFSTGSGGFLVEAARRIVDDVSASGDPTALDEGLRAIVLSLQGSEISPFPYFLTEVNLLLQVSRLLGRMREAGREPPGFVLGVVPADTLAARAPVAEPLERLSRGHRADRAEMLDTGALALVASDPEKQDAFRRIREGRFDLVIGNPPYVFEAGNKVLFDRLRALPQWRGDYRGKTDYLYYFLILAAEKVAPGGRLCVITPAGWMNAGNADWLRAAMATHLRLDELFLFGGYALFAPELDHLRAERAAPPPTVESAILVATRTDEVPADHRLRIVELRDPRGLAEAQGRQLLETHELLRAMGERATPSARSGNGISARWLRQADLRSDVPWPIKHGERELASRVVRHLERQLEGPAPVERLDVRWKLERGIETAADAYTRRIQRRLSPEAVAELEHRGARIGDPILELPPGRERLPPWDAHPEFLARSPESRALLYGAVDAEDYSSLVWIGRRDDVPREVIDELERFKPLLETRAEIVRNPGRRWYETVWPRDKSALRAPKVIALYRTDRGRFALDETGEWQPSNKATVATPRDGDVSVAYLCGLLNSELLDLWYAVRGKNPRDVWRNYEPKPMARMPYRHVSELVGAPPEPELAALDAALGRGDLDALLELVTGLPEERSLALAQALERIVRALAANRRALLPERAVAPDLRRQIKDPWSAFPVAVSPAALVAQLPSSQSRSVRLLDEHLELAVADEDRRGRVVLDADRLTLRHGRRSVAHITGPHDLLRLLGAVLGQEAVDAATLRATLLPVDLVAFSAFATDRQAHIAALLREGRMLVEAAERLVGKLYGASDALVNEVVAHAGDRSSLPIDHDEPSAE